VVHRQDVNVINAQHSCARVTSLTAYRLPLGRGHHQQAACTVHVAKRHNVQHAINHRVLHARNSEMATRSVRRAEQPSHLFVDVPVQNSTSRMHPVMYLLRSADRWPAHVHRPHGA
jgi:ketopantoate hydroxymethyltransferase